MSPAAHSSEGGPEARLSAEEVELSLPACFEKKAALHASRKAIGSGIWQPTYEELNHTANRLARGLLARGGTTGDRVAVLMTQDGPMVAAVLAVLKAGRIVVVLNSTDPPARLEQLTAGADPNLILVDAPNRELGSRIAGSRGLVAFEDDFAAFPNSNPCIPAAPDDVACLAFTSGSAGQPKGVMGTHRSVLHHVFRCSQGMEMGPDDRIAPLSSLSGGQGMGLTWCALLNGAAVCLFRFAENGVDGLPNWMMKHRITILAAATSVFRRLVKALPEGRQFPDLRLVRIGSEGTGPEDFASYQRCFFPGCVLMHAYSTSESGNVAQLRLTMNETVADGPLPVGRPVEGVGVLLLDEQRREVAPGETGEIVVRSRYLSPGYWGDVALTEKVFSKAGDPGEPGLYHTGDFGRFTAGGELVVTGRKDDRVNIRGFSIELSEIEHALRQQPGVGSAMVCARTDARGDNEVVACVVPQKPHTPTSFALREALRQSLPAHLIPPVIALVDTLPLTATGKPDRQEMLAQLGKRPLPETMGPRTELEARLAPIWSRSLELPAVGVYDSFFEKGGDSLRAVDLMMRLSADLGGKLPMDLLINHPTIAQMAEAIESGFVRTAGEPWFRLWQASLLTLRRTGSRAPLLFIPGGYTSENELLVCAGLLPFLDADRPVFGVRLNFQARRVLPPWSLGAIARKVARLVLRQGFSGAPVIIGECQSCCLALEIAQLLARWSGSPSRLVLLDPWQPSRKSSGKPPTETVHPPAVARYYRLSRRHVPNAYPGEVHVVCAEATSRLPACIDWWSAGLRVPCHGHEVPGDHDSYIRQHRTSLAKTLNAICEGAG